MSDDGPDLPSTESGLEEDPSKQDAFPDGKPSATGVVCQNCGSSLAGKYCHDCGQRHLPELRLRDLGRHFLETVLDIEGLGAGLHRTFIDGIRSPGSLARQYVDGKRRGIVSPIAYFLITSTVVFLIYSFFRAEWVQGQAEMMRAQWEAMGIRSEEIFREGAPFREIFGWSAAEDMASVMFAGLRQIQSYFGIVSCFIAAGILRGLFAGETYVDLVVFELYTYAQVYLVQAVAAPILMAWSPMAFFAVGPVLLIGLHALTGPGFFGRNRRAWVLPPLAIATTLIIEFVVVGICAFVFGFIWGMLFL